MFTYENYEVQLQKKTKKKQNSKYVYVSVVENVKFIFRSILSIKLTNRKYDNN